MVVLVEHEKLINLHACLLVRETNKKSGDGSDNKGNRKE